MMRAKKQTPNRTGGRKLFQPGVSGNPAGRPPGTKSLIIKIREEISAAVIGLEASGAPLGAIIQAQLKKNPLATLKVLAGYMPRQIDVGVAEASPLAGGLRALTDFLAEATDDGPPAACDHPGVVPE
jgi:hypothetical protein